MSATARTRQAAYRIGKPATVAPGSGGGGAAVLGHANVAGSLGHRHEWYFSANTPGTVSVGTPFLVAFAVSENGGVNFTLDANFDVKAGNGTYQQMANGSKGIRAYDVAAGGTWADGAMIGSPSNLGAYGSDAWQAGDPGYEDLRGSMGAQPTLKSENTSLCWSVSAGTSALNRGTAYRFRIYDNGAALTAYDQTPRVKFQFGTHFRQFGYRVGRPVVTFGSRGHYFGGTLGGGTSGHAHEWGTSANSPGTVRGGTAFLLAITYDDRKHTRIWPYYAVLRVKRGATGTYRAVGAAGTMGFQPRDLPTGTWAHKHGIGSRSGIGLYGSHALKFARSGGLPLTNVSGSHWSKYVEAGSALIDRDPDAFDPIHVTHHLCFGLRAGTTAQNAGTFFFRLYRGGSAFEIYDQTAAVRVYAGGQQVTETFAEQFTGAGGRLQDALAKTVQLERRLAEAIKSDNPAVPPDAETPADPESLLQIYAAIERRFSEDLAVLDSLLKRAALERRLAEQLAGAGGLLDDALAKTARLERRIAETLAVLDTLSVRQILERRLSETLAVLDTLVVTVTQGLVELLFAESVGSTASGLIEDAFSFSPFHFRFEETAIVVDGLVVTVTPGPAAGGARSSWIWRAE